MPAMAALLSSVVLGLLARLCWSVPRFNAMVPEQTPRVLIVLAFCAVAIGLLASLFRKRTRVSRGAASAPDSNVSTDAATIDFAPLAKEAAKPADLSQSCDDKAMQAMVSNRLLARELKRVFQLQDLMNEGVVAIDNEQRVLFANKMSSPFLHVAPQDAVGRPVRECLRHANVLDLLSEAHDDVSQGVRSIELPADLEAGHDHAAVFQCRGFGADETVGQLLMFRDIGRIKRMEQVQSEFVDHVAHELRTPLTSIRAYIEMLIDGETQDTQTKYDFYNVIYEETYRLSQLIDNLLSCSMMESGAAKLTVTPTRIKRLLEECVDVVRSQCEKKKVALAVDLPDRLPTLNIDKRLFGVAVMNILGNAVKYTPEGRSVAITTASAADEFLINIRDTGVGIAEAELSRIFEKFYRCSATEEMQGSGIGLATALQAIRLHGGDIRVSSKVGEGTQFSIVIPRTLINTAIGE